LVTAESLCCGTPVVGFKAGAPEQIAIEEYSEFVEWGNNVALAEVLCKQIHMEFVDENIAKIAADRYSKRKMVSNYVDVYRNWENRS
jgi:glycosyltransferase involved in cell wall biosynthesis